MRLARWQIAGLERGEAVREAESIEDREQAAPRLAGGDAEHETSLFQRVDRLERAVEQRPSIGARTRLGRDPATTRAPPSVTNLTCTRIVPSLSDLPVDGMLRLDPTAPPCAVGGIARRD